MDGGCSGGRCIVFTETKNDATELAGALKLGTARALHGDIPQNQREVSLFLMLQLHVKWFSVSSPSLSLRLVQ